MVKLSILHYCRRYIIVKSCLTGQARAAQTRWVVVEFLLCKLIYMHVRRCFKCFFVSVNTPRYWCITSIFILCFMFWFH